MEKEIRLSAPNICEEEALKTLARFFDWKKNRISTRSSKDLFKHYSFGLREYKNSIVIRIYRKQEDENEQEF